MKKRTVSGLMLILLILSFLASAFNFQPVKAEPRTIIVPDDADTIQEAIDAANPGDTIYVREGTYYELVTVNEQVSIIGENRETTIVDGFGEGDVFSVYQDHVNITGFTITNGYYGICLYGNYCNIIENDITANDVGVDLYDSNHNNISGNQIIYNDGDGIDLEFSNSTIISGNNITNSTGGEGAAGVDLYYSNHNAISGNQITYNSGGINLDHSNSTIISGNNITENAALGVDLYYSNHNAISGNQITYNSGGINLDHSNSTIISGNNIAENSYGVYLDSSPNCTISGNTITNSTGGEGAAGVDLYSSSNGAVSGNIIANNVAGVSLDSSSNCTVSGNTIADNMYGVNNAWSSYSNRFFHNNFNNNDHQVYSYSLTTLWDNGYPSGGNYWSKFNGTDLYSGPYQNETGNDLISDTPLFDSITDNYPLMTQWTLNTPNDMVVAYPYEPGSLDPARAGDTASMELFLNVYETLTFFDEEKTNQFIPHLATKWEISPDGLTYTFTIRQGVKFHNGETLTTEDVEYSLERFLVIEGIMAYTFYEPLFDVFGSRDAEGHFIVTGQQIDNAITRNQTTVTIHLTKPYPPFMQILSQAWTSILCKNWCISIGDWPGTWNNWTLYNSPDKTAIENQTAEPPGPHLNAMCGTGPYMLDYYRKGVEWSMVKFDNYWGGWPAPGSNSFLQRVTAKKVMNWEVRKNWFLEGQLDYTPVPENAIDQVLGAPGIKCVYPLEELICYAMFFTFNISTSSPYLGVPGGLPEGTLDESGIPPDFFSDINVRKGFAYAFNYTKLIEEEVRGEAYQPATPIVPGLPFYNPAQEKYAINLTKAAEYFAAAWNGELMEKGFNFTICYYEGNLWRKKVCEIVKANVESISSNFHIQIQSLPTYNQYLRYSTNHSLPIFGFGWLADYADPHDFAYGFMYSGGGFPPLQMYSNQTIDTLVLQGIGTMNETARRQIYYELQSLYHEDCPSVPLYQPIGRRFERDWVQGWYYNPLLVGNYFYIQWKGSIHLSTTYSWPMLHHDLTHAGYSDSPAPNTNQTLWKYNTSSFVFTSPAIVDGKVYFGSYDRNVYCLDALTGTRIWNYTTGEDVGSSPTVVDGRVYIGSADHNVYCLDASSGALIWNHTLEFSIYSSPAFAYGRVYIGSRNCLNASNGALLWSNPIGSVGSSPAVVDGKVYADSEFYGICCLDAFSGALIWNYTSGYDMRDPAVVDGRVYFGSWGNKTYCLNALTGEQIWNYTTGGYVLSLPAVAYGKVYVGSYDNKLYCLDALTGERIWSYTTGDYVGPPSVADNKVYVVSEDGKTYCFDASTGAAIWSYYTFGGLEMPPAVADGIVFVGSVNGVYAFGKVVRSDDYPTIQAAINNATAGATIIIAPGIYNESIVVNKTLTIIGLPGSAPTFNGGGSGIAITLLPGASGSTIAGIVITHWDQGILIIDATNIKIYDNIMSLMNCNGITLEGNNAANNLIYSNILQDNTVAVNLTASSVDNTIYKNIISSNNIGLSLESSGHVIYANTISENEIGINILNSGNIIYHNNFIDNTVQVYVSMGTTNTWDDGYPSGGNYWSIYTSPDLYSGSNTPQNNPGSDGIVDTQYTIATNNVDRYPLLQPFNPHDIGITNVITSKTVTGQGFSLLIEVKILNYGVYTETFTITAYANTIVIATQTITQESRNSCIITLTWNTSGFVKGMYTITAYVWPVQGETDTADNNCPGGSVLITKVGDLGGGVPPQFFKCDGFADGKDLALFLQCYRGQAPSQAMYLADLGGGVPPQFYECDGIVNGKDLALFLICFHGSGP